MYQHLFVDVNFLLIREINEWDNIKIDIQRINFSISALAYIRMYKKNNFIIK